MANEKRLIDANLLVKDLEFLAKHEDSFRQSVILGVVQTVNTRPTVDAVHVVRCRDCKHLNVLNRKELYAHCPKTNTVFLPFDLDTREHFCSLGERKDGDGNG